MKDKHALPLLLLLFFFHQIKADVGRDSGNEIVEILMWSGASWAGYLDGDLWRAPNYLGHDVDKTEWNCPVDCRFTTDKSRIGNVDAVIFESQPVGGYFDEYKFDLPQFPSKHPSQQWIELSYETHAYFMLSGEPGYMDFIDINMTFDRATAEVPITFTCLWGGGHVNDFLKPPPPKTRAKCVAYMASNCDSGGAEHRTQFVSDLMEYMSVDSYGKCLHTKDLPQEMIFPVYSDHGSSMRNKIKIFSEYKFVLTFENNNVTDYVTEKLINVLQAGTVPIYMGAPNIDDWTPGDNSIIKTSDFDSAKDMSEFLLEMCRDDEKYAELFEWKKKGLSQRFKDKLKTCVFYGSECRLCQNILERRQQLSPKETEINEIRKNSTHYYLVAKFLGDQQYLEVEADPRLDLGEEFSISMWVISLINDTILLDRGGIYKLSLRQIWQRTFVELCVKGNCYLGTHRIIRDRWHHITAVFSVRDGVYFVINGRLDRGAHVAITAPNEKDYENGPSLLIGTDSHFRGYYQGYMDDLSIWNVALSPSEARKRIWDVLSPNQEGLAAYWSFNRIILPDQEEIPDDGKFLQCKRVGSVTFLEALTKALVTANPLYP